MYQVLLVDDEEIIIEGMSKMIPWKEFGCELCACARSAEEGLEKIREFHPDIVFADVRMKRMTGLEMIEQAQEDLKNTQVVVISGYRDFEYVKKALSLGVIGFVVKPTKLEELKKMLQTAVDNLDREREKVAKVKNLKQELQETQAVLTEKLFWERLQSDGIKPEEFSEQEIAEYQNAGNFVIITVNIERKEKKTEEIQGKLLEKSLLYGYRIFPIFSALSNEFAAIITADTEHDLNNQLFIEFLEEIQRCFETEYFLFVSIGISSIGKGFSEIKEKYLESKQALEHRKYTGGHMLLFYEDVPKVLPRVETKDSVRCILLMEAVLSGNVVKNEAQLEAVYDYLCKIEDLQEVKDFIMAVIDKIYDSYWLMKGNGSTEESHRAILPLIQNCVNFEECFELLSSLCRTMVGKVDGYAKQQYSLKIKNAVDYIKKHYNQEISRDIIAEHVGVSPNYISAIFKKEMKMTLVEYIKQVRIENAKQLLWESDLRINEIADIVGFSDGYYFSRIFKDMVGVTPTQYRKKKS
ncbi:MAG: response regulator [Clostridia bacterium]|nr:response regulator [Clostridia bacterium]